MGLRIDFSLYFSDGEDKTLLLLALFINFVDIKMLM
jgi:hypothetical protein